MERAIHKLFKDMVGDVGFKGLSTECKDNIKSVSDKLWGRIGKSEIETEAETIKESPDKAINDEIKPEPVKDVSSAVVKLPEWCESGVEEDMAAYKLLDYEGLNHSSFTRQMGLDSRKPGDKAKTRNMYEKIMKKLVPNYPKLSEHDKINKQGHDWFLNKDTK